MIRYEVATRDAVADVADRLREADRKEVWLATGCAPHLMVMQSFASSRHSWVATVNGRPECVFGVADGHRSGMGVPWMLGTDAVVRHQRALLVDAPKTVAQMHENYHTLYNMVHAENAASIRWLRYLGFKFQPQMAHGPFNAPFIPFYRTANV